MAIVSRYNRTPIILGGQQYGTSRSCILIFTAVKAGSINYTASILKQAERLDVLAGRAYGDSGLWWVIAAASGIGWGMQAPPGTLLKIPNDIGQIVALVG
jgi:hypothetical protein